MVAPSLIVSRRFPEPVRLQLQVAYARAWEELAHAHEEQVVAFVRRVRARLGTEDALHRYFREVAVPMQMQETVRARALLALTPEERMYTGPASLDAPFRADQLVDRLRRRAQYVEETNLSCRLAAAVSDEAICVTHVQMALEVARVLEAVLPLDEALMHYIRAFELASVPAQLVFQRALARLADGHPLFAASDPEPVVADEPRPARRSSIPTPIFGLRAIS